MNEPIDIPSETQAVVVRENGGAVGKALPPEEIRPPVTAAQAKIDAIAHLTMAAYEKAATLHLTAEESVELMADFPDEAFQPGAAGKENLIYIEHAWLRNRFNSVFGLGQWAIVPRNRWAEPFRTQKGDEGQRVYVEAMLVVRGCFVGEAIGAMEYYPKNASQNYGDAVEGAKTAAFRRCAKEFGVGLQAWRKEWCAGWWARRQNRSKGQFAQGTGLQGRKPPQNAPQQAAPESRSGSPPTASKPAPAAKASTGEPTIEHLEKLKTRLLEALGDQRELCQSFMRSIDWLMPNETIDALELRYVPVSKEQFDLLMAALHAEEPKSPYPPNPVPLPLRKPKSAVKEATEKAIEVPRDENIDPNSPQAPWRTFPVPFGKHAGVTLEQLDKAVLFGFWANFEVETEYNGKPKKPETIERDQIFRTMLDEAGKHYEFTKPEDKE